MKKLFLTIIICLVVISCKKKKTEDSVTDETVTIEATKEEKEESSSVEFIEFDWSAVPVSDSEIGSFPYIAPPRTMCLWTKNSSRNKVEEPYTKLWDFSRLIMFDGKNFFNSEGKRAFLYINMEDKKADFNQYLFDKSVKDYLEKIGAVQIYKGQIDTSLLREINKKEGDASVHNYVVGDPWNDPLRNYVLHHKNGKIVFQIWSNSSSAEIEVIELEGFKQTIKAPTASEIKEAIDKDGKAILYINFDVDKATLKEQGEKVVNEIKKVLETSEDLKLSIEGHTDNTGSARHNKELSEKRANTVKYALASKGIDINRLSSKGFGAEKPLAKNDTEENKAKNRRVELVKQ